MDNLKLKNKKLKEYVRHKDDCHYNDLVEWENPCDNCDVMDKCNWDNIHNCDNPPCCNPKHLIYGDSKKNFLHRLRTLKFIKGKGCITQKLNEKQVIEIINSTKKTRELSRIYNVSYSAIDDIKHGRSWKKLIRKIA